MPCTASLARPLQTLTASMSAHARSQASATEFAANGAWAAIARVCTSPRILAVYVGAVIGGAFLILALRLPHLSIDQPLLFVALLGASGLISASKVHLPLVSGSATLSMSYFTDFMSLVLLGPDQTMIVAGVGGVTQCLLSTRNRVPLRQVVFSVAALIISIQMSGVTAAWLGGFHLGQDLLTLSKPAVGAAATFFVCNSWLVATAVALSRRESIHRLWQQNFMWTAPACFIGAGVA